jgi:hypothetical protein
MIGGASVEDTLTLFASSLRDAKQRIRPLFTQERVAASAWQFLDGLLGNEPRKTGWMWAEAAGDPGPWRQQAILGRGQWDADALRDIVRECALETLGDKDAVMVIDETGFLKQGKASCGVARQYTGSAGKITNCQIGVFASYVSRHGHAFIDRALYLPKEWTSESARLKAAHVPSDVGFATKPKIARQMITRAIAPRCRSRLWLRTACMAPERSKPCCARRAKAMFWVLRPIMCLRRVVCTAANQNSGRPPRTHWGLPRVIQPSSLRLHGSSNSGAAVANE